MAHQSSYSPIYRSKHNKIIGGVCGGLGEYFNIDPNIIRLIFVLLTVFGGSGVIIYLVLWIILPSESQITSGKDNLKDNLNDVKERMRQFAHDIRNSTKSHDSNEPKSRNLAAYAAILLGTLFLLNNFGFSSVINIDRLWPLLLILLGISLMLRK